jgi:hypothetical protein
MHHFHHGKRNRVALVLLTDQQFRHAIPVDILHAPQVRVGHFQLNGTSPGIEDFQPPSPVFSGVEETHHQFGFAIAVHVLYRISGVAKLRGVVGINDSTNLSQRGKVPLSVVVDHRYMPCDTLCHDNNLAHTVAIDVDELGQP